MAVFDLDCKFYYYYGFKYPVFFFTLILMTRSLMKLIYIEQKSVVPGGKLSSHWKSPGKSLESHGRALEELWKNLGRAMGELWKTLAEPFETLTEP